MQNNNSDIPRRRANAGNRPPTTSTTATNNGTTNAARPARRPAVRPNTASRSNTASRPNTASRTNTTNRSNTTSADSSGIFSFLRNKRYLTALLAFIVVAMIVFGIAALIIIKDYNNSDVTGNPNAQVSGTNLQIYKPTPTPGDPDASPNDGSTPLPDEILLAQQLPTPDPGDAPKYEGGLRSATIRNIGDFVIHKPLFEYAAVLAKSTNYQYAYNFAPMLNYIREVMSDADYTVANIDGPTGGKNAHRYGYRGYPDFNTPETILLALKDAGVDMLTLANNHALDTWFDGLVATVNNVEKAGLAFVGASRTQEERDTPKIVEINGIKVGFMNYTCSLNSFENQPSLDKRALEFGVNWVKRSNAYGDADALNKAGADVIVCYMHWGDEDIKQPDSNQLFYANELVKAGVDIIIGGHSHVVQPAKWLSGTNQYGVNQRTLCLYSMGNFLSDQRSAYHDGGIVFEFTIQERTDGTFEIASPRYIPVWVWRTGNESSGFTYTVVPPGQYINSRPTGMSDSDYARMMASYQEQISQMSGGVGTLALK